MREAGISGVSMPDERANESSENSGSNPISTNGRPSKDRDSRVLTLISQHSSESSSYDSSRESDDCIF